jgi:hypothetical protein
MRAEELDSLSEEELRQKTNDTFVAAEGLNIHIGHNYSEKLRLQLEAQYYLSLVARKRDDRTAKRDFWMEVAVIVLISIEIILSVVFGLLAIHEGNQQAKVLAHMDSSSASTATAMSQAMTQLQHLADEQKRSADRLEEVSANVQASADAARSQLKILRQEQTDTLAERSRKPKLALFVGGTELDPNKRLDTTIPGTQTDTSATIHFVLRNAGDATAHGLQVRVVIWDLAVTPRWGRCAQTL